jgi:hypothetical protein
MEAPPMKLTKHDKLTNVEEMRLRARPLRIYITRGVELTLEKGDQLGDVVERIARYIPVSVRPVDKLVAFWFAVGERLETKTHTPQWSKKELSTAPGRRYLA